MRAGPRAVGACSSTRSTCPPRRLPTRATQTQTRRLTAEIERLYVLRHFHGQGLGKALMAAAAEAARHAGCTRLWLTAWVGNAHARAWYGRQGWRDIGATPYIFKSDGFEGESFANRVLVKDA